jgi:hypothetical protein
MVPALAMHHALEPFVRKLTTIGAEGLMKGLSDRVIGGNKHLQPYP